MHLVMLLGMLGLAGSWRYFWSMTAKADRWRHTLEAFLLPPLLLFTSAIAVVWMGPHGLMVWGEEGRLSYGLAWAFLGWGLATFLRLIYAGWQVMRQIRTYPSACLNRRSEFTTPESTVRLLDIKDLFIAQIGFWRPELVISQGLLEELSPQHLAAVLAHEQAHYYYRDTFWFFWLGWIRYFTAWLPKTKAIWQELLVLRELRADAWAAGQSDSLLLAESLLLVGQQNSPIYTKDFHAAFSHMVPPSRLVQRIDALLESTSSIDHSECWSWHWLLLALLPLAIVPFHM
jgi:Zn-dependent protease with chaperone function